MRTAGTAGLVVVCVAVAGCGSTASYKNQPRPPSPINVTAALSEKKISLEPKSFGAGPVTMIISNQTSTSQVVTVESDELGASTPGTKAKTAPIGPLDTAELQMDVKRGTYKVATQSGSLKPVSITVGKARKSAQGNLLQP